MVLLSSDTGARAGCAPSGTGQICTNPVGTTLSEVQDLAYLVLINGGTISGGAGVLGTAGLDLTNLAGGTIDKVVKVDSGPISVVNSGSISGEQWGILDWQTTNGTIVNTASGSIAGADAGVYLRDVSGTVSLTNAGVISGMDAVVLLGAGPYGIPSTGTVASVFNSGVLGGDQYGLRLQNFEAMSIVNTAAGTISGGYAGVATVGGSVVMQNAGTIEGGVWGVALQGGTPEMTAGLVNSGTITSRDDAGLGVMYFGAVDIVNAAGGNVSGYTAGVVLDFLTAAHLVNAGSISGVETGLYVGDTVGLANITNSGTITGGEFGVRINSENVTLSNSGTISGGHAAVFLGADNTALNIYNGAVFANGVDFNGRAGTAVNFHTGSYTLDVRHFDPSANTVQIFRPTQFVLLPTEDDFKTGGTIRVVDVATQVETSRQLLVAVGHVGDTVADVADISRPTAMPPLGYASTDGASVAAARTGAVMVAPDAALDTLGNFVWMRGAGSALSRSETASEAGTNGHDAALMFGLDRGVGGWRLGLFGGSGQSHVALADGSGASTANFGFGGFYGRVGLGGLTLDAEILGGGFDARTSRAIGGTGETASGTDHGWFVSPQVALSASYVFAPDWSLIPKATVRYTHADFGAYAEGGSSQDIAYAGRNADALEEKLELRLQRRVTGENGLPSRAWLTGAVFDRQAVGAQAYAATIAGTEVSVDPSRNGSTFGGAIGLGFETMIRPAISLNANVLGALQSDRTRSAAIQAGLKIAF